MWAILLILSLLSLPSFINSLLTTSLFQFLLLFLFVLDRLLCALKEAYFGCYKISLHMVVGNRPKDGGCGEAKICAKAFEYHTTKIY